MSFFFLLSPLLPADPNGWYNSDVVNQLKACDALSGLDATCQSAFPDPVTGGRRQDKTTSGEGTAVKVSSDACTDEAGNTAAAKTSAAFKIDKTDPAISDLGPTTPANANGWYKTDVVNQFKASDALSGLDATCQTALPDPVTGGRRKDNTTRSEDRRVGKKCLSNYKKRWSR